MSTRTAPQEYPGTNRRIVLYGNPALRTIAAPIREITPEILRLAADLQATLKASEGIGLAANQIGVPVSVFVLAPWQADVDLPLTFILNPEIISTEGLIEEEEGCLSLPGIFEVIARPEMVEVRGIDLRGNEIHLQATGLLARAIVHEFEHLQGILFIDHISELRRQLLQARLNALKETELKLCG
ncbi:MAG: peptide deformylase [candidate division WOR-3 bacterium]|uniref:Peptide deformylase n=1 Tax=candidate division WOR-3 bacterium TaxID=2052148 RepID=A0A7C1SCR4_UNCW3|nr:peptide deformylase [candidate division WOR-3 bacterium]